MTTLRVRASYPITQAADSANPGKAVLLLEMDRTDLEMLVENLKREFPVFTEVAGAVIPEKTIEHEVAVEHPDALAVVEAEKEKATKHADAVEEMIEKRDTEKGKKK